MKKEIISVLICCILIISASPKIYAISRKDVEKELEELIDQYEGTAWTGYYHGSQCKGFANMIFHELFGVVFIGSYDNEMYYLPSLNGAYEIGKADFSEMTEDSPKEILSKGQPGDFVQVRRRGKSYGNSMIFVSKDENGITFFDCNSLNDNKVMSYYIEWDEFYTLNSAFSLYRAENYSIVSADQNIAGAICGTLLSEMTDFK